MSNDVALCIEEKAKLSKNERRLAREKARAERLEESRAAVAGNSSLARYHLGITGIHASSFPDLRQLDVAKTNTILAGDDLVSVSTSNLASSSNYSNDPNDSLNVASSIRSSVTSMKSDVAPNVKSSDLVEGVDDSMIVESVEVVNRTQSADVNTDKSKKKKRGSIFSKLRIKKDKDVKKRLSQTEPGSHDFESDSAVGSTVGSEITATSIDRKAHTATLTSDSDYKQNAFEASTLESVGEDVSTLDSKINVEPCRTPSAKEVEEASMNSRADAIAEREAKAKETAELEAKANEKAELEAIANAESEAKAKAELEVKAKADLEAKAKAKAELEAKAKAKAKAELEAKAKAELEAKAKAKAELEAKAKAFADAKAKADKTIAEAQRKLDIEAKAKEALLTAADIAAKKTEVSGNEISEDTAVKPESSLSTADTTSTSTMKENSWSFLADC